MNKKTLILSTILILFSCSNKIEKFLAVKDRWKMNSVENERLVFLGSFYKFNQDGTYTYYFSFDENKPGYTNFKSHNTEDRKWFVRRDSLFLGDLTDRNLAYKILKCNNDTLWLSNLGNSFVLTKFRENKY